MAKRIENIRHWDARRNIAILKTPEEAVAFAAHHWVEKANEAIDQKGRFAVALSGGSTPKSIYTLLSLPPLSTQVDWSKVHLFWSDERSVFPDHPDSNYYMAMEAGF